MGRTAHYEVTMQLPGVWTVDVMYEGRRERMGRFADFGAARAYCEEGYASRGLKAEWTRTRPEGCIVETSQPIDIDG